MRETRSTCPYCGVGCGVVIEHDEQQITGVRGDPDHPANFGRLCTKGSTLHLTAAPLLQQQTRLLQPMRRAERGGALQAVAWDAALDEVAQRFADSVLRHGPDSVGLYLSGQLLTEDYYVFNKLAKGLIGTNNVDSNSRLCMSSAVAGYKASLGSDAPPACYDDIALAGTVFIAGANTAWAHPVLYRRLEDARRANPSLKVIVVDPRRTETAAESHLHLPLLPGTDLVLFHAMLHVMLWDGLTDTTFIEQHTSGFATLRDRVREFTPAHAAKVCGLQEADIVQAARWFAGVDEAAAMGASGEQRRPTLSLYCQGLNQSSSGTDKNTALINLHLATGQIGRPGAGPLSLTGQPNAMGGREVGGLANLLSGHRDLANASHRAEVAALWGVSTVPERPGKSAVEMFQAAADGEIHALWIVCTNPAQSMPDQATVRAALQRCEFVVLQEAQQDTSTARYADLLLPATTWGEKSGTVTNSERRISRVRAALPPMGEARHDWAIAVDVARRMEALLPIRRAAGGKGGTLFPYAEAESVWNEHRESTRGRDLDIAGLSWAGLEQPRQWPFADGATEGTARLYTDHRFATPDGRARFTAPAWTPPAEPRDARYPIALNTGRLRDQWHGMSRTGNLGRLFAHTPEPALQLNPQELQRRGWTDGELIRVQSRRGSLVLPVQGSDSLAPAQAFIAMHWGDEFLGGAQAAGVNALTTGRHCPQSRQPELKHAAVRLEHAKLAWGLLAAAWLPADRWVAARRQLQALMPAFEFASCVPFGRETALSPAAGTETAHGGPDPAAARVGLLFRAASTQAGSTEVLQAIERALQLSAPELMRYADPQRGQHRTMAVAPDGQLRAFVLAGDLAAQAWVLNLLQQGLPAVGFGRALLAARAQPPQTLAARSPQVCACHDVSEATILAALPGCHGDAPARLAQLQSRLRCGTECGSCLPAVKALLQHKAGTEALA
ncbi:MAG: molybdopterin-dependent oxidoreductase [Ideonella sp.]|nr:molybdopterin-dependent oxidoreductase [Ideonella sp.]